MTELNKKIVAYLTVNDIKFGSADFTTGQPSGQPDQILYWNTEVLGVEPTTTRLDETYAAYESQQNMARIQMEVIEQTQSRLDAFAKTRNYDGILSLCTYATSTNIKFQAEGQYGVTARDATWAKLYEILAEVEAGTRPMPVGFKDIEPELPILQWPLEVIT